MSYTKIKCFNRQDKSTSIYYIYVLKHMHRNHAKIKTKRVPKLSSPLDGFFKLLASNYKKKPSYPHPQKTRVPWVSSSDCIYTCSKALKLLIRSLFCGGGGVLYLRASVNTSIPPLKISCIWTTNQNSFISTKISLLTTKPHEQETQI